MRGTAPGDSDTARGAQLAERIRRDGPLTFDVFMTAALYDPQHGYYARAQETARAGPTGDFTTAPTLTPLFGAALARFAAHAWQRLGAPPQWLLLEPGGGTGALLAALAGRLTAESPQAAHGMQAVLVDVSPVHRAHAAERLEQSMPRGAWEVRGELPQAETPVLVVANELLDDQAVRILEHRSGEWLERVVDLDGDGRFTWRRIPAPQPLVEWVQAFGIAPPDRHVVEVPVGAAAWLESLTRAVAGNPAVAVLIDYGEEARDLIGEPRAEGTLLAYAGQARDRDVLHAPGTRNITAHVNWSAVARAATEQGWQVAGYTTQFSFLAGLGALEAAAALAQDATDVDGMARLAALKEVLLPGGMGEAVKVLILTRGFEPGDGAWPGLETQRALEPAPRRQA